MALCSWYSPRRRGTVTDSEDIEGAGIKHQRGVCLQVDGRWHARPQHQSYMMSFELLTVMTFKKKNAFNKSNNKYHNTLDSLGKQQKQNQRYGCTEKYVT